MPGKMRPFDPRQVMLKPTFEVFHSLDTNTLTVDPHHHDFYEIYFLISGEVEYRVEGRSYEVRPGELMLISPWKVHQPVIKGGQDYERIVLWVDRNHMARFTSETMALTGCFGDAPANLLYPSKLQGADIKNLLDRMETEGRRNRAGSELYMQGLFLQLMVEINRLAQQADGHGKSSQEPDLVNRVLAYIGSHYEEQLSLQSLADRFFVSKYYLSHAFSAKVGTGVHRYLVLKRLSAAREQIAAGCGPGEACQNCGFRDYTTFYRAFKAEYGVSPKEFSV